MFLAFCDRKAQEQGQLPQLIWRTGLGFAAAEGLSYPVSMLRTRACSYPRKKGQTANALLNNKLFFGFFAALQRSLLTFFLRSTVFAAFGQTSPLLLPIGKHPESSILAAAAAGVLLNAFNVVGVKAQCSQFRQPAKKALFISILKEIWDKQNSRFTILRTGLLSFALLQTAQAVMEFQVFMHFHSGNPDKPGKNIAKTAMVVTLATGPLEFMNTRYVLRKLKGLSTPNILKYAVLIGKREGVRAFYSGCGKMLIRNFLFNWVIFGTLSSSYQIP